MKHTSPAQARTKRYYSRRYNMIGMAMDRDLERLEEWARRRDRRQRARKIEQKLTEIHYRHHPELVGQSNEIHRSNKS